VVTVTKAAVVMLSYGGGVNCGKKQQELAVDSMMRVGRVGRRRRWKDTAMKAI
jgi:hypothetical protein